jgi:hypothetical protein
VLLHCGISFFGEEEGTEDKFAKENHHICELKILFLPECCQLENNKAKVVWLHQINFLLMGTP